MGLRIQPGSWEPYTIAFSVNLSENGGEGENTTFVYKVSKKSGTMVTTTIIINMYQVGLELGVGRTLSLKIVKQLL